MNNEVRENFEMSVRMVNIGAQLHSLLSDESVDNSVGASQPERIVCLIDKTIELIEDYRKRKSISKKVENANLIECVFSSCHRLCAQKQNQVMSQCVLEFLQWCREQISKGGTIPRTMLINFCLDTAHIGYLGNLFYEGQAGRSHQWIPIDTFWQVYEWFCFDKPPERERLTSEFLCIFELRQAMEVKFRRLLGIGSISDGVRIKHDLIPNVLKEKMSKANFDPGEGIELTQIMHVYDWASKSIHDMKTDCVWVVWKAMMVVSYFFRPKARSNGMMCIHDSFEFSDVLLEEMRNKFVNEVKRANKCNFTIEWVEPEAAIVDENGKWMKVGSRVENVKFDKDESGKRPTRGSEQTI